MLGKDSLIGNLVVGIKEHSKSFGIAGAAIGAILVIYYCGSIKFYPSELTIADTLFFLWAVVVFGFYYSVVAIVFFVASIFWVAIFSKPINFFLKFRKNKYDFVVPLPKNDWFTVLVGGIVANVTIFGVSYIKEHSFLYIFFALFIIGFIYTAIENLAKKEIGNNGLLVDSKGNPISTNPINTELVTYIFYIIIYAAPLLVAQVGGGVTRTTFETMGVRQINVDIAVEAKYYQSTLENYKTKELLSSYSCTDVCLVEDVNILFTSIGSSTKIQMTGAKGMVEMVIPSKSICFLARQKPNKNKSASR